MQFAKFVAQVRRGLAGVATVPLAAEVRSALAGFRFRRVSGCTGQSFGMTNLLAFPWVPAPGLPDKADGSSSSLAENWGLGRGDCFDGFWGYSKSENGFGCFPLTHQSGDDFDHGKIMRPVTFSVASYSSFLFGAWFPTNYMLPKEMEPWQLIVAVHGHPCCKTIRVREHFSVVSPVEAERRSL